MTLTPLESYSGSTNTKAVTAAVVAAAAGYTVVAVDTNFGIRVANAAEMEENYWW